MQILRAYKTQIDPNNRQAGLFWRSLGTARFVYNWALADRIASYEKTGKSGNYYDQKRRFNALKDAEYPWIREVPYSVTASAFSDLDTAFQNFFRRIKGGEKPGFPKFKKRGIKNSFTLRGCIHVEGNRIKLPRIGWVRLMEADYLPCDGEVKVYSATISGRGGKWYVSLQVEEEIPDPLPPIGDPLGIDVGIKQLAVFSDGTTFENPRALTKYEHQLARLQRELSRRRKGSKNREKTKAKIARCYAKIANVRRTTLHTVSAQAVKREPSAIVMEDLNVKGMMKNHNLAKAIGDSAISELRRQIGYKADWHGIDFVLADRFYPSSKTCSNCGAKKTVLGLSQRIYICEECGFEMDRDLNAAINLATIKANGQTDRDCLGS